MELVIQCVFACVCARKKGNDGLEKYRGTHMYSRDRFDFENIITHLCFICLELRFVVAHKIAFSLTSNI